MGPRVVVVGSSEHLALVEPTADADGQLLGYTALHFVSVHDEHALTEKDGSIAGRHPLPIQHIQVHWPDCATVSLQRTPITVIPTRNTKTACHI